MGATNVAHVFTHWTQLGHREARLLTYLALVSRDDGRPPVYFGGWADAARAIGLDPEGNPDSARRNVFKSLVALADAGALVSSGKAHAGRRAEYALTLDPARSVVATGATTGTHGRLVTTWTTVDRTTGRPVDKNRRIWDWGTETVPQRVTGAVTQEGDRNGPNRVTGTVTPRTHEEPLQEYREENIALDVSTYLGPVDNSAPDDLRGAAVVKLRPEAREGAA